MNKIAIHSVPRSGSSWLGQIFNSSPEVCFRFQPLFSYAFKDRLNESSTKDEIDGFFTEISLSHDEFLLQRDKLESGMYPTFDKADAFKHVVYKEVRYHHILNNMLQQDDALKVIGLIRNPFSVINSFLRAPREFRADLGWDPNEEWLNAVKKNAGRKEEFYGYNKWKEVALMFHRLGDMYPGRFCIVDYNMLLKDPVKETERIFEFCGIEMSEQTCEFLESSKRLPDKVGVYSVYNHREKDDAWVTQLDAKIAGAILNDLSGSDLGEYV